MMLPQRQLRCFFFNGQADKCQVVSAVADSHNPEMFYHTIERGQTVYAIATMYGVSPDDIYRLNPESREGIRAGAKLLIPQREGSAPSSAKAAGEFTYHTIQPKETLYSLTVRYEVPATDIIRGYRPLPLPSARRSVSRPRASKRCLSPAPKRW